MIPRLNRFASVYHSFCWTVLLMMFGPSSFFQVAVQRQHRGMVTAFLIPMQVSYRRALVSPAATPSQCWLTTQHGAAPTSTRTTTNRKHIKPHTPTFMAAYSDDDAEDDDYLDDDAKRSQATATLSSSTKTLTSLWNIPMLKKEATRAVLKCHKKIGKASTRLQQQQQQPPNGDDETVELQQELQDLQQRLERLNQLETELQSIKNKEQGFLPESIAKLALELEVNDEPPPRPERGPKKPKGPRKLEPSRLPYRRYFSLNNVEIRVGKQAEDNDELSLSPQHRDGSDWWMHAAGCPGSHVVIRSHDQNLNEEIVQDAAALAARQSKCTGNVIRVSMTQCRHIVKPPGAKAGLVQLTGPVRTIVVNMKDAQARLARLDKTVLVN